LVLAWELSPLSELARPERVSAALQDFAQGPWGPLVVVVAFTAGSLLLFPVTILIAATAAAFGPWLGFAYAALGTMSAALLTYAIGRLIGREALSDVLGPRLNRVREKIRRRGVIAVALIRLVPLAPFTIVNLAAGASDIRLVDFLLGTALGMLPGIVALAALGQQIGYMMAHPSVAAFVWLTLAVAGWIALSLGLQAFVSRFESKRA
jgi:phospholipase D1/2